MVPALKNQDETGTDPGWNKVPGSGPPEAGSGPERPGLQVPISAHACPPPPPYQPPLQKNFQPHIFRVPRGFERFRGSDLTYTWPDWRELSALLAVVTPLVPFWYVPVPFWLDITGSTIRSGPRTQTRDQSLLLRSLASTSS